MSTVLERPGIGSPLDRRDGRVKVTGRADYTADVVVPDLKYGVFATSPVTKARIVELDTVAAQRAPGVRYVMTHRNAPRVPPLGPPAAIALLPLQNDRIRYEGQPIALIVADTLEDATYAAGLVSARFETAPARTEIAQGLANAVKVEEGYDEPDTRTGDPEAGLRASAVLVEHLYTIGYRHHNPMEPSATTAVWDGDRLTLYDATQYVYGVRGVVAQALDLPPENVRVVSHFLGGGFGSKGYVWPHQVLTALAAREAGCPVKLVLTRAQMYTSCGYQPETRHAVAIGADRDGTLRAITHDVVYANSAAEEFPEYAAAGTRSMYACPSIATTHRAVKVDLINPTAMRAPNEGMGNFALESALDELAYALNVDPLELRLRNYAGRDPLTGKPFSSKKLREAYALGAERFGWAARPCAPRSLREGDELIGYGMASALMTTYRMPSTARVEMAPDGTVTIATASHEIGTGVRTIMPQIAADVLGVDPSVVTIELGDTDLPEAAGTFGSATTVGVGSAVSTAATQLKERLIALAVADPHSPLHGLASTDVELIGGEVRSRTTGRAEPCAGVVARSGAAVRAEATWSPSNDEYAMFGFGAVFVEVRVDAELGLVRLRRCVGAYSAGRIVNPKTAASQMTGAMIWGIGQALLERSETDANVGRFVSKNLAGYLLPVNADVGELEAHFVDEFDPHASAIRARHR